MHNSNISTATDLSTRKKIFRHIFACLAHSLSHTEFNIKVTFLKTEYTFMNQVNNDEIHFHFIIHYYKGEEAAI